MKGLEELRRTGELILIALKINKLEKVFELYALVGI